MLAHEPALKLTRAQHLAHNHVVRAVVSESGSAPRQSTALTDDDFVSIQQP
jgi:hypothetical protein